jgi:hypothetical protein
MRNEHRVRTLRFDSIRKGVRTEIITSRYQEITTAESDDQATFVTLRIRRLRVPRGNKKDNRFRNGTIFIHNKTQHPKQNTTAGRRVGPPLKTTMKGPGILWKTRPTLLASSGKARPSR